jgi:hypothetical protein
MTNRDFTHYESKSKGRTVVADMHSAHLFNTAASLRAAGDEAFASHMEKLATTKERQWHDEQPEDFAAWREKTMAKTPEKVKAFYERHGLPVPKGLF